MAPPNILLSYFGEVKLTDFGLARSILKQEHTAPGGVFGRAAYLGPVLGRGEVAAARSDIYSLGVVVWELLTGHQYLQLQNVDAATAMSLVRHPNTQAPSSKAAWITPELDAVIMRALAPAREDRYQSAEDMRQALSHVIARLSPRADAERSAEFLRALCGDAVREEQIEREHLLGESIALAVRGLLRHADARARATAPTRLATARRRRGGAAPRIGECPSSNRGRRRGRARRAAAPDASRPPTSRGASSRAATRSCACWVRAAWAPSTPPSTSRSARASP